MARGKGKYGPKSKILVVLKSAHHKFLENALSKLIFSKVENGTPYCIHTVACRETRRFNISNQKSGQDSFICQDTKYIDKRCLEDLKICHKFQHQNLQKSQGYYNFRLDFIYGPFSDKAVQQTQFFDKFLKTHRALRN